MATAHVIHDDVLDWLRGLGVDPSIVPTDGVRIVSGPDREPRLWVDRCALNDQGKKYVRNDGYGEPVVVMDEPLIVPLRSLPDVDLSRMTQG